MGKKTGGHTMYFPTTRVLTVLELLQSRKQMSGRELAERLEVDLRTVRRYIVMLQDLGIPVEGTRGRYGAYHLRPGYKLPPLMFNDEEALAITLGLLIARKMGLNVATAVTEGALAKIERVLPVTISKQVQAVQETLSLDVVFQTDSLPRSEFVMTLSTAALQHNVVWLRYHAYEAAATTERLLDPYGLVYRSGYWYVAGYCHLRQGLRTFRLDRIVDVRLCSDQFSRPDDFDCLEFVTRSISQTPGTYLVEVWLETTLEEAQRIVPPALALLEPEDGGVLLRCYFNTLRGVADVLVNLHCAFVVRQPDVLRDELRLLAQRIATMAERT
jgi:predicted DNA-binding transcriptional regulator YafY